MLLDEREDDAGRNASLVLLSGIPRRWLEHGQEIHVARAPTRFGELTFDVVSHVNSGRIDVTLDWSPRRPLHELVVMLFHPAGRPLRSASVNGKPIQPPDGQTLIIATPPKGRSTITALF